MSEFLAHIQDLVAKGEVRVSDHGYDALAADDILIHDAVRGIKDAQVVEEYPESPKGPCVLVLERDLHGNPIHVLWGIPKGAHPHQQLWSQGTSLIRICGQTIF